MTDMTGHGCDIMQCDKAWDNQAETCAWLAYWDSRFEQLRFSRIGIAKCDATQCNETGTSVERCHVFCVLPIWWQ